MTYSEDTLTSRKPPSEKEIRISDLATKVISMLANLFDSKVRIKMFFTFQEFLETLKDADVLPNDWEVVFPDTPIDANEQSEGVFSVAG